MDSQSEFFGELPQSANPRREFAEFRIGRKIIQIPCSLWKDGRIRADASKYGKGVLVSRNRHNLGKRIREIFANALAETDELIAEAENTIEGSHRVRNRRSLQTESAPALEVIDFIRPADYRGEFSNCPSVVDRMIGPTHLQKRLFGYLWAGAKCTGLKSHKLILAAAASALGATDNGVKKAAEQLRDAWNLIWFEKTNLGRAGWAEVRFPRPDWMPRIPNTVRDSAKVLNLEDSSAKPEQSSQNPEDSSEFSQRETQQRERKKRKILQTSFLSRPYDGPTW